MPHTLLYGGTFDPIHLGHLIVAQRAKELLNADRVLFIPARISPHKLDQHSSTPQHRVAMLQLAIAGAPAFDLDLRELTREGPSYTIDTVEALEHESPGEQFTLLIGADQLPKLHTWHRAQELFDISNSQGGTGGESRGRRWAVVGRPPSAEPQGPPPVCGGVSWASAAAKTRLLPTPLIEISATDIRNRVKSGLPIEFLVPPEVAEYIRHHALYRT